MYLKHEKKLGMNRFPQMDQKEFPPSTPCEKLTQVMSANLMDRYRL